MKQVNNIVSIISRLFYEYLMSVKKIYVKKCNDNATCFVYLFIVQNIY